MTSVRELLLAEELSAEQVEEILRPFGFKSPQEIDAALQRMSKNLIDRLTLAEHIQLFLEAAASSPNPEQCILQLERLSESYGAKSALYNRLGNDPGLLEMFFKVASCSRTLSDVLVLDPENLAILSNSGFLSYQRTLEDFRMEAYSLASVFQNPQQALDALRRMRRREYLRIGARELSGLGGFRDIVGEISDLACALVNQSLSICYEALTFEGEKPPCFAVIGFGKLGACELNYSSDIDLAFVWDTGSASESEETAKFYQKLAQYLIDAIGKMSAEGRMYRVDMRLRPYGKGSPIATSFASFLSYYESWSEPWERQALLKARAIAGPPTLQEKINRFITDFAFSRSLDSASISQILALKERSESFREKDGPMARQVKHGWGGIRDVEFTVQLLQLVAGSRFPEVRCPATLDALERLSEIGLITRQEEAILSESYVFLRQVEHRLQIAEELPMQVIPEDPEKLKVLARSMGFEGNDDLDADKEFLQYYDNVTSNVRKIHERLFKDYLDNTDNQDVSLSLLIEQNDDSYEMLSKYFRNPQEALRRLRFIARGPEMVQVSSEPQRRFLQYLPNLLTSLSKSPDPDLALKNLQSMAEATGSTLQFFWSIGSKQKTMDVFSSFAGSSEFLPDVLVRRPEYIDMLADPSNLARTRSRRESVSDLKSRVSREESLDSKMNAIRRYRLRELLRIGVRDISGIASVRETTEEISILAEACLQVSFELAGISNLPGKLCVLGLGKLGGRELHYSSDLDLVCVYRENPGAVDAFGKFQKVVMNALEILSKLTVEGRAFEVDLRLRPEGNAGMIVFPIEGYLRYLGDKVQVWERQSLVRARYVTGDRKLADLLVEAMHTAVWGKDLTADDIGELRHIKRRIENELSKESEGLIDLKRGEGGILDLEFTVQMLQLAYGGKYPEVRNPNTMKALNAIRKAAIINFDCKRRLADAYLFLRRAENRMQIISQQSAEGIPTDHDSLAAFARSLGYSQSDSLHAVEQFRSDLAIHTKNVRSIHEQIYFETDLSRSAWSIPAANLIQIAKTDKENQETEIVN